MRIEGISAVVTGGASGLGRATAERLLSQGAKVVIADLPNSSGEEVAAELGPACRFVSGDVTSEADMVEVFTVARDLGPFRATVHCAGKGGPIRVVDKNGEPGSLAHYESIIRINLIGSFNVLRLAAAAMARTEEEE